LLIDVLRFTIYDYPVIPLHLKLSGFLSYHDPVEVDFSSFDLACISGSNGAGKSSLLDAITWALFGQARKRDEAVINLQSKVAEVAFTFAYEGNIYRVLRSLPRGKGTTLEFQIAEVGNLQSSIPYGYSVVNQQLSWRPLTERTLRDTQVRIEHILRLDYDTFVNVSFFLQGRADQFAQQPPTRRKEILGAILGLEAWEIYRNRAAERRKAVERELDSVDGRVAEIDAELAEEEPRQAHLAELESQLKGLAASRKLQETALANVKQVRLALDRQRELVTKLAESRMPNWCSAPPKWKLLMPACKRPASTWKSGSRWRSVSANTTGCASRYCARSIRKAPGCSRKRPGWKSSIQPSATSFPTRRHSRPAWRMPGRR
jgi:exonuclease SbcC